MERWVAGNTYCHPHSRFAFGYFFSNAKGRYTAPNPSERSFLWKHGDLAELRLQGLDKPIRQHGDTVLASFPVPDDELVLLEVHVLDAQPGALHEPQSRAVQETRHHPSDPVQARRDRSRLLAREHDR